MMNLIRTTGYVDDIRGYSGAFSWWRSAVDRRFHTVMDMTGFCAEKTCRAVTDDYGNLVKVAP